MNGADKTLQITRWSKEFLDLLHPPPRGARGLGRHALRSGAVYCVGKLKIAASRISPAPINASINNFSYVYT